MSVAKRMLETRTKRSAYARKSVAVERRNMVPISVNKMALGMDFWRPFALHWVCEYCAMQVGRTYYRVLNALHAITKYIPVLTCFFRFGYD